ncbi:uncharacterized protein LOC128951580 [Oppia nitens]|uniref:uncharacterized protein LOC128951580 n=1 Tax=Oppia nitens TaxID=1686743 RepID=UPI0023DCBEE3|nr:uncharacterized protein LOC128951580 [Oppia nitens]
MFDDIKVEAIVTLSGTELVFTILFIICQIVGSVSNIICICLVRKSSIMTKQFRYISKNRPKLLMANICLSDTILTMSSWLFRYCLLSVTIRLCPLAANILQSSQLYLENLSLYVTGLTFTLIAWDRYYSLSRVFNNPFDKLNTRLLVYTVWLIAGLLALPFMVISYVDYYDYHKRTVMCAHVDNYHRFGLSDTTIYMYKQIRSWIALVCQFIIPTLLVTWYSGRLVFEMLKQFRQDRHHPNHHRTGTTSPSTTTTSVSVIRVTHITCAKRCYITKRLITCLFVFIMTNTMYAIIKQFNITTKSLDICPKLTHDLYYIFSIVYRFTTSLNSLIFFWFNQQFCRQFRQVLWKCLLKTDDRCNAINQRRQTIETIAKHFVTHL